MVTTKFKGTTDAQLSPFTVTNWADDRVLVCTTDDAALGNVLGTLIKQLMDKGILTGSVAST